MIEDILPKGLAFSIFIRTFTNPVWDSPNFIATLSWVSLQTWKNPKQGKTSLARMESFNL
ncbi:hypothetical protein [Xylanibacter muris]|uniref:Uncharacterized protein n=2 Tax=Xylanibacter muris TaxID=2736290 RepID=A0ABX2AJU4_9BACT|nr:hypothetical protein [Xylanibacter muris]NPD91443.1 hypothetical protein [Xylanibacter muris]